jgi:hypothetical protein
MYSTYISWESGGLNWPLFSLIKMFKGSSDSFCPTTSKVTTVVKITPPEVYCWSRYKIVLRYPVVSSLGHWYDHGTFLNITSGIRVQRWTYFSPSSVALEHHPTSYLCRNLLDTIKTSTIAPSLRHQFTEFDLSAGVSEPII